MNHRDKRVEVREDIDELRLLVENVRDYAIFMLDPGGHVQTWNPGAERIKGYTASEIIGQHFSVFYPPETKDKTAYELEVAAAEGRFEDEGWRVRKDGSYFWANVVITAVRDRSGKLCGFGKVTRDLTTHRWAEEQRFQRLFNTSPNPLVISTLEDGRILEVNEAFLQFVRLSREAVVGRTTSELQLWAKPGSRASLVAELKTNQRARNIELALRNSAGEERLMAVSADLIELQGQEAVFASLQDVTEMRQLQQAIRQLSMPLLQIRPQLLILPLIGVIDPVRAGQLTQHLLATIRVQRARAVVMDITGVPSIDAAAANQLVRTIEAARLLGATVIVSGVSRRIAQTLVDIGIDMEALRAVGDLQTAIEAAEKLFVDTGARRMPVEAPPDSL